MAVVTENDALSIYLAQRMLQAFDAGVLLPSERALAEQFRCSRGTVRAAIAHLSGKDMLQTLPRQGHMLVAPSSDAPQAQADASSVTPSVRAWPTLALLTFGRGIDDPGSFDAVPGAITQAGREQVNLLVVDMGDPARLETLTTIESFHPGCEVDGYVIMGKPPLRVRQLLEKTVRPCVVLGTFHDEMSMEHGRFLRVGTPSEPSSQLVAAHLVSLGHRRIMVVAGKAGHHVAQTFRSEHERHGLDGKLIDCLTADLFDPREDFFSAAMKLGDQVMKKLKDHTALFVDFGGYGALSIWRKLLESGRRIPEELSVIMGGGRVDIFVDAFEIATIRRSANLEGEVCVREAARQVRTGRVEYGFKQLGQEYLPRRTVGPAPRKR